MWRILTTQSSFVRHEFLTADRPMHLQQHNKWPMQDAHAFAMPGLQAR